MADVRFVTSGTPVVGDFASSTGTPLVIDISTGDIWALLTGDVVTLVGSVAAGSSLVIAGQAFGKHMVPQVTDLGDAPMHLASRVFDRQVIPPSALLGDSAPILQAQVFGAKRMPAMWS